MDLIVKGVTQRNNALIDLVEFKKRLHIENLAAVEINTSAAKLFAIFDPVYMTFSKLLAIHN